MKVCVRKKRRETESCDEGTKLKRDGGNHAGAALNGGVAIRLDAGDQ